MSDTSQTTQTTQTKKPSASDHSDGASGCCGEKPKAERELEKSQASTPRKKSDCCSK